MIGPSEVVPIVDGRLALGTWQQLVLIDFDDRPRERTVIVQVTARLGARRGVGDGCVDLPPPALVHEFHRDRLALVGPAVGVAFAVAFLPLTFTCETSTLNAPRLLTAARQPFVVAVGLVT